MSQQHIRNRRQEICLAICAVAITSAQVVQPASAQDAWWSLEGDFQNAEDEVTVHFDLAAPVDTTGAFWLRTFGHSGGVNAVGDTILGAPGSPVGFDPIVSLYGLTASGEVLHGRNDDGFASPSRDAWLTWPGVAAGGGSITTDPLPLGDYRAELTAFEADYPGVMSPWAMDLYGPWFPVTMSGVEMQIITIYISLLRQ